MVGFNPIFYAGRTKLSEITIDSDLDMGTYAVKADAVKVGSISEKIPGSGVSIDSAIDAPVLLRGAVDGASGALGVDETRPIITASGTAIYSKSYSAGDRKVEVTVSCVIPEFLSGSINLYYTGTSVGSNRNKGYKFYKNDVLLQEDFDTDAGTVTGNLDVNVVEGDTLKIVGYGSGGSHLSGTSFTIAFRGDITYGTVSQTFALSPGVYPTEIPFTVEG